MFDCIVVGAGVVGCATADRLSMLGAKTLLLEAEDDVASGASRANSGIVHAGYDCEPNTLKAKFNVEGSRLYEGMAADLDTPYKRIGSLVVADCDGLDGIKKLYDKGIANGVKVEIIDRKRILELEPNVADEICFALYAPEAAIVSPYKFTIALADRAVLNGATVLTETKILSIQKQKDGFIVKTSKGDFEAKTVVNAAGAGSADINALAGAEKLDLTFKKGEYFVLDKTENKNISRIIFPLPDHKGKGILATPTADGNVLYGPTAVASDAQDTTVFADSLKTIKDSLCRTYKTANYKKVIRLYAGVRVVCGDDFVVEQSKILDGFVYLAGICSPGLSSAPAIANYVADIIAKRIGCVPLKNPVKTIKHKRFKELSNEQINKLVAEDERWGRIICRCETVSEAEIVAAIHSPVPATTVDAVKRRVRAGMGRCQGGFCAPRIMEILSRELNIPMTEIKKGGKDSNIVVCKVKEEG